jgi:hypothetical protein
LAQEQIYGWEDEFARERARYVKGHSDYNRYEYVRKKLRQAQKALSQLKGNTSPRQDPVAPKDSPRQVVMVSPDCGYKADAGDVGTIDQQIGLAQKEVREWEDHVAHERAVNVHSERYRFAREQLGYRQQALALLKKSPERDPLDLS